VSSTTELFFARHDDQEQRSRTHDVEPRPAEGSEAQDCGNNLADLVHASIIHLLSAMSSIALEFFLN